MRDPGGRPASVAPSCPAYRYREERFRVADVLV
jgi:hypothetical protein